VSLVGSVLPVIDTSAVSRLASAFGWNKEPPIQLVVSQLLKVIPAYDERSQVEFSLMLKEIYSYFDRHITEFDEVSDQLPLRWICYSSGFAEPSQIVLKNSFISLQPHVFVMSASFAMLTRLWKHVGVGETCNLVGVLNRIAEFHNGDCQRTGEEVSRDLDLSVCILNEIAKSPERSKMRQDLHIPVKTSEDKTLVLKPIDDCTYCDKEWFHKGFDVQHITNTDINLVHPQISIDTAEALNIHSVCSRLLDAEELDSGGGVESYGQSEPLTVTIMIGAMLGV
jgi:sacsin